MRRSTILCVGLLALLALLSLVVISGCAHEPYPSTSPLIDPRLAYEGPTVSGGVSQGGHAVTVVAPTGGWNVTNDRVDRRHFDNRVFLTIVRPPADAFVTQAAVGFNIDPAVRADEPLAVYARVVEFGADASDVSYRMAAAFEGSSSP